MTLHSKLAPEPDGFGKDPFGYAAMGWHKWALAQTAAGFPVDPKKGPTSKDLKSPVLWLSHTHAMSQAAMVLIQGKPNIDVLDEDMRGIAHCQYHAIALMLLGYSLEICLKGMLIMKKGVEAYQAEEKDHYHHDLVKLAELVPGVTEKDKAVLRNLVHFVKWAGRYPDPGFGKLSHAEEIFSVSEQHRISARDLFETALKVTRHVQSAAAAIVQQGGIVW